jgi:hypothetical protein
MKKFEIGVGMFGDLAFDKETGNLLMLNKNYNKF